MFPDLQTDPDFPAFAESADPTALQDMESMMRQNEVAEFLMQWTPTEITDLTGRRYFVLAREAGEGEGGSRWDLVQSPRSKSYALRDPLLVEGISALNTPVKITNTPVSLQADSWVVLRLDDPKSAPPSYTLAVKREEEGQLKVYEFDTDSDDRVTLKSVDLPLWKITSESTPASVSLGPGLYGVRYVSGEVLALVSHRVAVPDKTVSVFVPRLYAL